MSRYDIHPVTYAQVADTGAHLFSEHWEEVARNKDLMVLNPDAVRYQALEATGAFFGLGAFADDRLVGYSGNFIGPHLHYSDLRYCNNDVLFVAHAHRASPLGLRLIRETVAEAQRRGARMMLWHGKMDTPLADLLPKLDYQVQDVIYSRQLPASNFQLYGRLDVARAAKESLASAHWDDFTARQATPGSAHHSTRSIILRGPDVPNGALMTADTVEMIASRDWDDNIKALPAVHDLCVKACQMLHVKELGRVMLVELPAGAAIDRHLDEGAYAAHFERFHLSLMSDEGNAFTCGDETIHMQPGELWRFNHHIEHEVANNSLRPRIHLILDAVLEG